jgi:PTS system nitrogen regulatory IIA component
MNIADLLTARRVICNRSVTDKKRVLELLGELIADNQSEFTVRQVCDSLSEREQLGSTGLGRGVALPHGRLGHGRQAIGAFVKLKQGVNFDAIDRQPVDLVFGLLVPEHFTDEHLKILAYLADMFSDQAFCEQLRGADSDRALFERLLQWKPTASTA